MMRAECQPFDQVPPAQQRLLACDRHVYRAALRLGAAPTGGGSGGGGDDGRLEGGREDAVSVGAGAGGADVDVRALSSAQLSQVPLLLDDHLTSTTTSTSSTSSSSSAVFTRGVELFPRGAVDVNNQQLDLRQHNSWLLRMHEVGLGPGVTLSLSLSPLSHHRVLPSLRR
jgi:hypothetical protein